MDDRERQIYQDKILIGELAKGFLREPLARYLVSKAHEEIEAVVDEFQYLEPQDTKKIINLQVRVRSVLGTLQWLNEAVKDGANALDEYMQRKEIENEEKEGNTP
jgi:hypothetical protein